MLRMLLVANGWPDVEPALREAALVANGMRRAEEGPVLLCSSAPQAALHKEVARQRAALAEAHHKIR